MGTEHPASDYLATPVQALEYACSHYGDYKFGMKKGEYYENIIKKNPELTAKFASVFDRLQKSWRGDRVDEVPELYKGKINSFIEMWEGNQSCLDNDDCKEVLELLKQADADPDKVMSDPGDIRVHNIFVYMRKSLSLSETAAENQTVFEGFDRDEDFKDTQKVIENMFSEGLFNKCLISEVCFYSEIVALLIKEEKFYLPLEKYKEWVSKHPEVKQYKFRAESFASYNGNTPLFNSWPIFFYSFEGEDSSNLAYLEGVPEEEKMRRYKLGTIIHELGHALYYNLMGLDERKEWEEIINEVGHLTEYSAKYASGVHGLALNYNEELAEAIRLYTTAHDYLSKNFPTVIEFLQKKFPEMVSMDHLS